MTKFHQIQALGKETVEMLATIVSGNWADLPKNYLRLCSIVYQAFKSGQEMALKFVTMAFQTQADADSANRLTLNRLLRA